jgi:hypothetical protein
MITVAQAKTAIQAWAASVLLNSVPPGQIVWLEQGSPRPPRPYVGLKVITGPRVGGWDDIIHTTDENFEISGQRSLIVSVNIYGTNPMDLAASLINSFQNPLVTDANSLAGIAAWTWTDPQDVSQALETSFEPRVQFDVTFGLVMGQDVALGTIGEVDLANETTGEGQSIH